MSLEICVLGSGSSGNSTVIRRAGAEGVLLLDAGFGPRATAKRLAGTGVGLEHIRAVCLTHLDSDHFNCNWVATLVKLSIRVFCHEQAVEPLCDLVARYGRDKGAGFGKLIAPFRTTHEFEPLPGLRLQPIFLRHDKAGSHGFVISAGAPFDGLPSAGSGRGRAAVPAARMGYATDLGRVPEELIARFSGVDLLMLESNYDPDLEEHSDRPYYLKRRIMGGAGHLSNAEAFAAVRAILDRTEKEHGRGRLPRHIVLLHRSRQCNCPTLVRKLFQRDPRIKGVLTLAEQSTPTSWLRLHPLANSANHQHELWTA